MDDARLMRLSRLRVMIEEEGLCNVIGEVANALEMIEEELMENADYEFSDKAKIIEYQKKILDMSMSAVDIIDPERIRVKLLTIRGDSTRILNEKYGA